MDVKIGKITASTEAVAHYNVLLTQAIFDVLEAKGLITKAEVSTRLQVLKQETTLDILPIQ